MSRWKKAFWISATLLALFALAGTIAPPVIAQIRAALVRDMDSPIRGTRHVENAQFNFVSGAFFVNETITPSIPAGKKLFIQAAYIHTLLTEGQSVMEARLSIGGVGAIGYVSQDFQAGDVNSNPQRHFNGSTDLDVLLSPGETINVFVFRNDNQGSVVLNFTRVVLRGYLVDANP